MGVLEIGRRGNERKREKKKNQRPFTTISDPGVMGEVENARGKKKSARLKKRGRALQIPNTKRGPRGGKLNRCRLNAKRKLKEAASLTGKGEILISRTDEERKI